MTPELFVVIGPNGSGKSSALYETQIDKEIVFVNPDDIARLEYADVEDQHERDMLAWINCNAQRDGLLSEQVTFGFETVGSHPSKVEFMARAKDLGYCVTLLFVSTEDPDINIRRIQARVKQGGHDVPSDKVRTRYYRTLGLLKDYFEVADTAFVWDNSREAETSSDNAMRELVRKTEDGIVIAPAAADVSWVNEYLIKFLNR